MATQKPASTKTLIANQNRIKVMPMTALPHHDGCLDYLADEAGLPPGLLVIAPLGKREVMAMVVGKATGENVIAASKLKKITIPQDRFCLNETMRRFITWVAGWYMQPVGMVLKMVVAISLDAAPAPSRAVAYRVAVTPDASGTARLTAKRRQVLESISNMPPQTAASIKELTGVSASTLKAMVLAKLLEKITLPPPALPSPDPNFGDRIRLTEEQNRAAEQLISSIKTGEYAPFLLDGVTGSGKTEVYFDAIAETLRQGKQALVLLPEIALSPLAEKRFRARFGVSPLIWHSSVSLAQKRRIWREAISGKPLVVIGARSALFLPFANLGLIAVDEEHDQSYRQDEGVRYHARDMAVVRARLENITLVLASATPSLETMVNAERGRYQTLNLPQRIGQAVMPQITLISIAESPPKRRHWLTPPLITALEATLRHGNQALLFLNRRGYAPMSLCRACHHKISCPNCSAWLVTHKSVGFLRCHHCGHASRYPDQCANCSAKDTIVACGPGVERLAEEVSETFPDARQAIFSSDVITTPSQAEIFTESVLNQEIDIIIGTQMIAKGHHFPHLELVGVIDADLGLAGGDLRAAEQTWQLLTQVAGRAGRAETPGKVLLQTAIPTSPVLKTLAVGDRDGFTQLEINARSEAGLPPFGRLAAVILAGPREDKVIAVAQSLARHWQPYQDVTFLGPAPAPISKLRGKYRIRFLIKAPREVNLQLIIKNWLAPTFGRKTVIPSSIDCHIDIDPTSFL